MGRAPEDRQMPQYDLAGCNLARHTSRHQLRIQPVEHDAVPPEESGLVQVDESFVPCPNQLLCGFAEAVGTAARSSDAGTYIAFRPSSVRRPL